MRFVLREQPYERPLASGRLRYERQGAATGALETWRLTRAAAGYRFLRVDLDARTADSGTSQIFHLTLQDDGRPERLQYRAWGPDLQASGNVLLEEGQVLATRELNGQRHEGAVDVPEPYGFCFPSVAGLALLRRVAGSEPVVTVVLTDPGQDVVTGPPFELQRHLATVTTKRGTGPPLNGEVAAQALTIGLAGRTWQVWLDELGNGVQLAGPAGVTAVESRYVRVRS